MGFFRAAFACVFIGASNTLFVIVRRTKRAANATAILAKNTLMPDLNTRVLCVCLLGFLLFPVCLNNAFAWECEHNGQIYECSRPQKGVFIGETAIPGLGYGSVQASTEADALSKFNELIPIGTQIILNAYGSTFIKCSGTDGLPFSNYVFNRYQPGNSGAGTFLRQFHAGYQYGENVAWGASSCSTISMTNPYIGGDSGGASFYRTDKCAPGFVYYDWDYSHIPADAEGVDYAICYYPRPERCEIKKGNPITASGQKIQEETDWSAADGMLSVERYYRSAALNVDGGPRDTSFGRLIQTWSFRYQQYLGFTGGQVTAYRPDNRRISFIPSGTGYNTSIPEQVTLSNDASGYRLVLEDDTTETYDNSGRLLKVSTKEGKTVNISYDLYQRIDLVTDSQGRSIRFNYRVESTADPVGFLESITLPDGSLIRYQINSPQGLLTKVTYADNASKIYGYLSGTETTVPLLSTVTDETGSLSSFTYNSNRIAVSTEKAGGVDKWTFTDTRTNGVGDILMIDPNNNTTKLTYGIVNQISRLVGQSQPGGSGCAAASSAMAYDTNGNIASRADFNQHKTCYAYDMARNLETARVEGLLSTADCTTVLAATALTGDARKITTTWHANYRLPLVITEPGRTTTDTYDIPGSDFLLHTQTIQDTASGNTRTWTYSYTTAADNTLVNLLKSVDGPRTDVADTTTYTYYSADDTTATPPKYRRGDLWKLTNALNQTTSITAYDGNGRPLTLIDPNSVTTTLAYTPRGWLKSKTVGSKTTSYDYDNVGQPTKVTLADGSFIQYTHDAAHRLTDITDNLLNRVHYTLDAIGNRVKEETFDSNNKLTTQKGRSFDALNRLWHDIAYFNDPNTPVATQYTYDANGNLTTVTAPANSGTDTTYRTTTFSYDALDRLQYVMDPINTTVHPTQYGFDGLDQVRSVTDPRSLTTSYTVNALGDTSQTASPDTATTNRTFDDTGNVKTETDASGIQASYSYDALNRLTSVSYPSTGENVTYTWDTGTGCTYGIGRLCQMTDGDGTTSYSYDDQGNLLKTTRLEAGVSLTTQYGFDGANNLTTEIIPVGESLSLVRNTAGQINTVSTTNGTATNTLEKQITYDGAGQVTSQTLGNGVILKASYDLSGQPVTGRFNKPDGDLNGDGIVNIVDVLFAARISGGLMTPTPDQIDHGDVVPSGNPDGKIDAADVMRILQLKNF